MKKYARYVEYHDRLSGIKLILIGMGISAVLIGGIFIAYKITHREKKESNVEENVKHAVRVAEEVADEIVFGSEGTVEEESYVTLKDVIDINKLQTFTYMYNSTCPYSIGNDKTIVFYTAYEGTVTFSINTEDIEVLEDEKGKVVFLFLPDIDTAYKVDAGTLEYIFLDEDYKNNSDVPSIAYKLAISDLKKKSEGSTYMWELAKDNTENELRALTEPIVHQMFGNDYSVVIEWDEEVN